MTRMTPNVRGALLMMASMFAFTANDAIVKQVGQSVPLFQLVALRGLAASLLIYLLARRLGAVHLRVPRADLVLLALRCVSEVATTYFFLSALLYMPLANVTAVLQALPFTVTLGALMFFREPVGWRRMLAIVVGFCGMLLIVRPGPDGFSSHAIYALVAVALITARDLLTRRMSSQIPSIMVTLCTALSVTFAALIASSTVVWVPLAPGQVGLIVAASVFILLGYLSSVMVMRVGDVGFVAPFRYSGLLWALSLGWLVFGDWPDPVTMLGALLVVSAGVFTLFRQRAIGRG